MSKFANLRQEYKKHQLSEYQVLKDPIEQFHLWFYEATETGVLEPNAFTLATVGYDGTPSARVLLLKGVDNGSFVFYTNYNSHKSRDLESCPLASMVFLWLELERQVRITGSVTKVSRIESELYFHSRPRESQIGAWVSHQSTVIPSREILEKNLIDMQEKFKDYPVIPLPEHWGGYRILPTEIEFWQGRPNRLHDRLLFTGAEGVWNIQRLAP